MKMFLNLIIAVAIVMTVTSQAFAIQEMVVSEQAKAMFNEENLDWKLYLHNGQLRTNSRNLLDILHAGEVACAITSMGHIQKKAGAIVSLTVDGLTQLTARDHYDSIQDGIDLAVNVRVSSRSGARLQDTKATLSCINLQANNLRMDALRNALGEHMTSKVQTQQVKRSK